MRADTTNSASHKKFIQKCIERDCQSTFDLDERIYVCPRCAGLLDIESSGPLRIEPATLKQQWHQRLSSRLPQDRSGVWRFREVLPLQENAELVTLTEGNTPLYTAQRSADYCRLDSLLLKHQGLNPTGSFKDTGMTVAVTQAKSLRSTTAVCASTGNTAASLAAYAARANLPCAILVPADQVSHAKLAQALDYGARVLELEGNFDACMQLVLEIAKEEPIYLVNSINPFRIEGQKTVAVELAEQLDWQIPDHLVVPGGNLGNSSAFGKGFRELLALGLIDRLPRITVVQAEGAAPFARFFAEQSSGDSESGAFANEEEPHTLASAIKIGAPVSWKKAWRAVSESRGQVITVSEQEIADAKAIIGRDGIGCEPASATTVAGIKKLVASGFIKSDHSVVAVLTGHVLKDTDYVIGYHNQSLRTERDEQINARFGNKPVRVESSRQSLKDALDRVRHESGSV
ncbi:MAG TPA: threonine synthase [Pyrinomonadaceae bacterium]|nr:threonine synthase [Pyrinomonadaceae bacterium]